jgi:predicted dehydrogenase
LATSLDEVDDIITASQQTGRLNAEAFMYRHHSQTLKVKELVDGGNAHCNDKIILIR